MSVDEWVHEGGENGANRSESLVPSGCVKHSEFTDHLNKCDSFRNFLLVNRIHGRFGHIVINPREFLEVGPEVIFQ